MGFNQSRLRGVVAVRIACAVLLVFATGIARAEFVTVGDSGNAGEYQPQLGWFGDVSYTYDIGEYEVTAGEYAQFLNAVAKSDPYGLYNGDMNSTTYGCKIARSGSPESYDYSATNAALPVNFVSWYDAARYCNWLTSGNSESGAYQFDGSGNFIGTSRAAGAAVCTEGIVYTLPTEDEWYKAAYYDPTRSDDDEYWWYPTKSDSGDPPTRDWSEGTNTGNNANHIEGEPYGNYGLWDVGTCDESESYYGTFDQGGNVSEWTETPGAEGYVFRGGSWNTGVSELTAENRNYYPSDTESRELGFRVVAVSAAIIPEPSTVMLLLVAAMAGLLRRRR